MVKSNPVMPDIQVKPEKVNRVEFSFPKQVSTCFSDKLTKCKHFIWIVKRCYVYFNSDFLALQDPLSDIRHVRDKNVIVPKWYK